MTDLPSPAQARLAAELAAFHLRRALRARLDEDVDVKANFDPNQPRTPPGNGRASGRWNRNGAALGSAASSIGRAAGALRSAARTGALGAPAQAAERVAGAIVDPAVRTAGAVGDTVGRAAQAVTEPLRRAPEAVDRVIAAAPPPVRKLLEENRPALTRAAGALQAAGGAAEGAAGAALLAGAVGTAPEGGLLATGAGAWMVAQGYDDFSNGLKTLISGEARESGLQSALRDFGFSREEAEGLSTATAGLTPAAALRLSRRSLDDAIERALIREAVDPFGPGLQVTRDGSFWAKPSINDRGDLWEISDSRRLGSQRLTPGFPAFDAISSDGRTLISNKTLDMEADTYLKGGRRAVQSRLKAMVDSAANWKETPRTLRSVDTTKVRWRSIHLLMPTGRPMPGQTTQIRAAQEYAAKRGVRLRVYYGR